MTPKSRYTHAEIDAVTLRARQLLDQLHDLLERIGKETPTTLTADDQEDGAPNG